MKNPVTPLSAALASEFATRARRAGAVRTVETRLQAARTTAEEQQAEASAAIAEAQARFGRLSHLRDRLEQEHARALAPSADVLAAAAAVASATERIRTAPVDDDVASNAAADAQANAEDRLTAAKQAQARNVRPLALRLQTTLEQVGDAESSFEAAQEAKAAADQAVRRAIVSLLQLRRDAMAFAFDEATTDLVLAGGAAHAGRTQMTLGESSELLSELGMQIDLHFGFKPHTSLQTVGRQDPGLLLDRLGKPAGVMRLVRGDVAGVELAAG